MSLLLFTDIQDIHYKTEPNKVSSKGKMLSDRFIISNWTKNTTVLFSFQHKGEKKKRKKKKKKVGSMPVEEKGAASQVWPVASHKWAKVSAAP